MIEETATYRRAELYEEIWKEPVRTVARRYGVSDVALRKICRRLNVPLPGRGHWARVRVGQDTHKPRLAPLADGVPNEIVTQRQTHRDPRLTRPDTGTSEPSTIVPADLRNPHKLVAEASRLLRSRNPVQGLINCWNPRCLDITVSPASLGRALRNMNAIIRALEKSGLQVEVTRPLSYEARSRRGESEAPSNATRVMVSGEWIEFGITEKRSVVRSPAPGTPRGLRESNLESWIGRNQARTELVPNGVLELVIKSGAYLGVRSLWHDGKRKRVEDCLDDFVAHLALMAEAVKQYRAEMERAQRERLEAERRRWEGEQRRREEVERARRFEEELARWRLARDVREYVAEVRALVAGACGCIDDGGPLDESLKWAEAYAKRVDPLARVREEVSSTPPERVGIEPRDPAPDCAGSLRRANAAGVRQNLEALTTDARRLSPSQKMSRANERRRRAVERKHEGTPSGR